MGRMDKKKKGKPTKSKPTNKSKPKPKRKSLSPLMQLVVNIGLFCLSFMFLIGMTYLPAVQKDLDFSVRKRAAKALTWAFPDYEIGTVASNRNNEIDNLLTVGYLQKKELQEIANC